MRLVRLALAVTTLACTGSALAAPPHGAHPPVGKKKTPLGSNGPLGTRLMSEASAWNEPIDKVPVDPLSAVMIAGIGANAPLHPDFGTQYNNAPWGIPYVVISGDTPKQKVIVDYSEESDGDAFPIPADVSTFNVEGSKRGQVPEGEANDQHLLVVDRDHNKLYEFFALRRNGKQWHTTSAAEFDLSGGDRQRPPGWTSADAAGLPILPGLARYDEVAAGTIDHALRFTTKNSRKAYVAPASHAASRKTDPNLPPMGARLRLKASINPADFPPQARPIIVALQKYGMILADNGGSLFLSGAPNAAWHDDEIEALKKIHGSDFEVVMMGEIVTP